MNLPFRLKIALLSVGISGLVALGRCRVATACASGQSTEVQYLAPGERTGHDIGLTVDSDAGMPIERIESPSHLVDVTGRGGERATVRLRRSDSIPNKDFVLRYRLAGDRPRQAMFVQRDGSEG